MLSVLAWAALSVLALAALGLGTITLMIRVLKSAARREAEEAAGRFRRRVMGLLERAEALRARLERFSGANQPEPEGRTREVVAQAAAELRRLMDLWTEQHAKLGKVDDLVAEEHLISKVHFEEAKAISLESIDACDDVLPLAANAEAALDLLEGAPSRAMRAISAARDELGPTAAGASVQQITALEDRMRPDPLGAAEEAEGLLAKPQTA
jgi:hypothetical protein